VAFEEPGYPDARNIFASLGAEIVPVVIDSMGINPESIPSNCKLVFVTPSSQCPTGIVLPPDRQNALLARAAAHNSLIVEDDYGIEFLSGAETAPALKSLDRVGRVIYIGSLSKILAPGLRLGYIVASPLLINELRALRRLMLRHPPANNQHVTSLFISLGYVDTHLRRSREILAERSSILRRALGMRLPSYKVIGSGANSSYWVQGPDGLDADLLAQNAAKRGVLLEPGRVFFGGAVQPKQFFRLGFASIQTQHIVNGIEAIAEISQKLDQKIPKNWTKKYLIKFWAFSGLFYLNKNAN
jgi:GntR family transcriptional regulator/MocR family aminotransferase